MLRTITPEYQLSHGLRNFEDELSMFVGTCIYHETPEKALEEFNKLGKEIIPHIFELLKICQDQ